MALTPKEQEERSNAGLWPVGDAPKYPHGLAICLNTETLEKLGVDHEDWEFGDLFDLRCMAKVTSVSEQETEGGKDCRIELQIVMMGAESEDDEDEA